MTIPLAQLPLLPSTLTLLHQRGFTTAAEVLDSKDSGGGIGTLALEWQVELPRAMKILQEIQNSLKAVSNMDSWSASSTSRVAMKEIYLLPADATDKMHGKDARKDFAGPQMQTANQLLQKNTAIEEKNYDKFFQHTQSPAGIISFSRSIDSLFSTGGIPLGSTTEIAGLPGAGKSQLAMQWAVNARLPKALGGVEGQTLYIDAEGSIVPERLQAMARSLQLHTQSTIKQRQANPVIKVPEHFSSPEKILEGIHVFRVFDEASQTATLYSLPSWIDKINKSKAPTALWGIPVKLVIIDSFSFHYRAARIPSQSSNFFLQRAHALTKIASFLNDVARDYDVAVVCLNQMTTKSVENSRSKPASSQLVPALGESWAHAISTRLVISQDDRFTSRHRYCTLVKSPCIPVGSAIFQVTAEGIRDVVLTTKTTSGHVSEDNETAVKSFHFHDVSDYTHLQANHKRLRRR